jgi:hypothetical protein
MIHASEYQQPRKLPQLMFRQREQGRHLDSIGLELACASVANLLPNSSRASCNS